MRAEALRLAVRVGHGRQLVLRAGVARARGRCRGPGRQREQPRRGCRLGVVHQSRECRDAGPARARLVHARRSPADLGPGPRRHVGHRSRQDRWVDAGISHRRPRQGPLSAQSRRHRQARARECRQRDWRRPLLRDRVLHDLRAGRGDPQESARAATGAEVDRQRRHQPRLRRQGTRQGARQLDAGRHVARADAGVEVAAGRHARAVSVHRHARRRSQRRDRSREPPRAPRQSAPRRVDRSLGRARAELDGHLARRRFEARAVVAGLRPPQHPRHQRHARRRGGPADVGGPARPFLYRGFRRHHDRLRDVRLDRAAVGSRGARARTREVRVLLAARLRARELEADVSESGVPADDRARRRLDGSDHRPVLAGADPDAGRGGQVQRSERRQLPDADPDRAPAPDPRAVLRTAVAARRRARDRRRSDLRDRLRAAARRLRRSVLPVSSRRARPPRAARAPARDLARRRVLSRAVDRAPRRPPTPIRDGSWCSRSATARAPVRSRSTRTTSVPAASTSSA